MDAGADDIMDVLIVIIFTYMLWRTIFRREPQW